MGRGMDRTGMPIGGKVRAYVQAILAKSILRSLEEQQANRPGMHHQDQKIPLRSLFLLEQGQHPYQGFAPAPAQVPSTALSPERETTFDTTIADELEGMGIGLGLSLEMEVPGGMS